MSLPVSLLYTHSLPSAGISETEMQELLSLEDDALADSYDPPPFSHAVFINMIRYDKIWSSM